jgi:hypothetical protein
MRPHRPDALTSAALVLPSLRPEPQLRSRPPAALPQGTAGGPEPETRTPGWSWEGRPDCALAARDDWPW